MSQIKVTIASNTDQKRFDRVLAQTVDLAAVSKQSYETMIMVHTDRRFDHIVKTISCAKSDALSYFISAYDRNLSHA